ncbi:SLATT domain-containing protein [Bacillus cereus]|uniref:SLATT domain-containing protein n=1 Tax=Bacillus cereus TaxID=1396 RepID=UPI003D64593A
MDKQRKLDFLTKEINSNIDFFEGRRVKNKKKAFRLKMFSIFASALITLLLGLKTLQNSYITDFTLLLSVLITVFNGIDGFYNHKELWAKDVITLSRLRELKREIEFFAAGEVSEGLSIEELTSYKEKLQNICNEDVITWSNLKEEQVSTKVNSGD